MYSPSFRSLEPAGTLGSLLPPLQAEGLLLALVLPGARPWDCWRARERSSRLHPGWPSFHGEADPHRGFRFWLGCQPRTVFRHGRLHESVGRGQQTMGAVTDPAAPLISAIVQAEHRVRRAGRDAPLAQCDG